MFTWVKGNAYAQIVTIYPNNITLNNSASSFFQDVRWVMVGIDSRNHCVAIKPITKHEIDLRQVPLEQLHKVSIGKGYGRISNKQLVEEIGKILGRELDGAKFSAKFDESQGVLLVDLEEIIQRG